MLRSVSAALRGIAARTTSTNISNSLTSNCNQLLNYVPCRGFGALSTIVQRWNAVGTIQNKTIPNYAVAENRLGLPREPITVPIRSLIKFSMKKGQRKTVRAVIDRFYRLNWGIWIRTKAGRSSHLWRKTSRRKKRLREHVFCNATQSTLLDKMTCKFWHRPRYYVDDPYNPYHEREEFPITRKRPLP